MNESKTTDIIVYTLGGLALTILYTKKIKWIVSFIVGGFTSWHLEFLQQIRYEELSRNQPYKNKDLETFFIFIITVLGSNLLLIDERILGITLFIGIIFIVDSLKLLELLETCKGQDRKTNILTYYMKTK